jgi:D-alanyl-D-alanine carboxypeptidase/D-alanyl-D-alanine-endopeptidase (penicillin-binding protein 4)
MVTQTLTYSDNFYAEMLLREAGAARSGHGCLATGVAAVRALAATMGVRLGVVKDGSGLSYDDRESPATLRAWLHAATRLATYPDIYSTVYFGLAISCETGTLQERLCGPHTTGRVHAKTGTLDHVVALSGVTFTHSGRRVTFSFLLSGIHNMAKATRHLDAAVAVLARAA